MKRLIAATLLLLVFTTPALATPIIGEFKPAAGAWSWENARILTAENPVIGPTVLIGSADGWHCSGSIVGKKDKILFGLTATHCVGRGVVIGIDPVLGTAQVDGNTYVMLAGKLYPVLIFQVDGDALLFTTRYDGEVPVVGFTVDTELPKFGDRLVSYGYLELDTVEAVVFVGVWTSLGPRLYRGLPMYLVTLPVQAGMSGGPIFGPRGDVIGIFSIGGLGTTSPWTGLSSVLGLGRVLEQELNRGTTEGSAR